MNTFWWCRLASRYIQGCYLLCQKHTDRTSWLNFEIWFSPRPSKDQWPHHWDQPFKIVVQSSSPARSFESSWRGKQTFNEPKWSLSNTSENFLEIHDDDHGHFDFLLIFRNIVRRFLGTYSPVFLIKIFRMGIRCALRRNLNFDLYKGDALGQWMDQNSQGESASLVNTLPAWQVTLYLLANLHGQFFTPGAYGRNNEGVAVVLGVSFVLSFCKNSCHVLNVIDLKWFMVEQSVSVRFNPRTDGGVCYQPAPLEVLHV